MDIAPLDITVRDLFEGYEDNDELGVRAYGGKLDVRPPYQREFVYKDKQRAAVIDTLRHDFPLNVMYWAVRDDGSYEIIDGQQRTISICQFVEGEFAVDNLYFHNLQEDEKEQVLNYGLTVYLCSGTDSERLSWFRIVNIAGVVLTTQELRNAVYSGPWLSHAKTIFSKNNCPAQGLASRYVKGPANRQAMLETAISWLSGGEIEQYMASHQLDPNANELWSYFQAVIAWVELTFTTYRKEMLGLDWGGLYDEFKDVLYDTAKLEDEIKTLMIDDDVKNKKGVYSYVLTRNEKYLSIRQFTEADRRAAYERQGGICAKCGKHFEIDEMEADHIDPWSKGGRTNAVNCQMLCLEDNRRKGAI
jgi:Protein of unknown function DUF262/HNH endonuclease